MCVFAQYRRRPAHSFHFRLLPLVITAEDATALQRQTAVFLSGKRALYHVNVLLSVCHCCCKKKCWNYKHQQMLLVAVCACVPTLTHSSLQQKRGLPLLNQIISWSTLGRWEAGRIPTIPNRNSNKPFLCHKKTTLFLTQSHLCCLSSFFSQDPLSLFHCWAQHVFSIDFSAYFCLSRPPTSCLAQGKTRHVIQTR